MSVTDFLKKYKIQIGLVGSTVVIATAYGSCEITPEMPATEVSEHTPEPAQEEKPAEKAEETAEEKKDAIEETL